MATQHAEVVPAPLTAHLRAAREAIDAAAGHLTVEEMQSASGGKWSVAETLEHLTLAFTQNAAAVEKALVSGELRARAPVLKQTLIRVLVVDLGYFPKVRAPEGVVPTGSIPAERCLVALQQALTTLDATLTRVAVRFGTAVPVANHPYFGGLTVPQWRKFHWRHTVHHMRQVRRR